jgi:hypothetical protein
MRYADDQERLDRLIQQYHETTHDLQMIVQTRVEKELALATIIHDLADLLLPENAKVGEPFVVWLDGEWYILQRVHDLADNPRPMYSLRRRTSS